MPVPGARVVVPLGNRTLTGVVIGVGPAADSSFEVRDVLEVLDADAFVPPDVVALTEWVSHYYLAGPGATLSSALPPHALTARVDRFKTVRVAAITAAGLDAIDRPTLGAKQHAALQHLAGMPDGVPAPVLAQHGIAAATLTRLAAMGLVSIRHDHVERDPFGSAVTAPGWLALKVNTTKPVTIWKTAS